MGRTGFRLLVHLRNLAGDSIDRRGGIRHEKDGETMKIIAVACALLFFVAVLLLACPTGCSQYEGNCACDEKTITATVTVQPGVVSDEKPPRHPQPAYERGDVTVDTPPSLAGQDEKQDREKANANFEGKKAAGL